MPKTRQMILDNLRSAIKINDDEYDDISLTPPKLKRETTNDYDDYDDYEETPKPKPKRRVKRIIYEDDDDDDDYEPVRRIPRRLKTPTKPKSKNTKLMKFNECLRKLKTENPNMSHREAQKNMRQILNQLNANGYEDAEATFMRMTKN